MQIGAAASAPLAGIHRGLQGLNKVALELASAEQLEGQRSVQDTTASLVEARSHLRDVEAAVAVIKVQDQMTGALLDVFA